MNGFEQLFLQIVNMSLTGSFVILGILSVRLLLKRVPRIYSYILWAFAAVKLVIPVTIHTVFSLIPVKSRALAYKDLAFDTLAVDTGLPRIDAVVNKAIVSLAPPSQYASINPMQVIIALAAAVWGIVAAGIIVYGAVNYYILKKKLCSNRHPYVGDASGNGSILQLLTAMFPENTTVPQELQTVSEPYGMTAYFTGKGEEELPME